MKRRSIRTDLAVDARLGKSDADLSGVELREELLYDCRVTTVTVSEQGASEILCKPVGKYITLELDGFIKRREASFKNSATALSVLLRRFPAIDDGGSFLIACLGNIAVTPDAVGPFVSDALLVTRHLKEALPQSFGAFSSSAVIKTGVLGTTGIESALSVKAACDTVRPDCVIAVDALASSELNRLCRCVQICDSGISPGSGVGNDREAICADTLGVPVIAVGVPTVIDAAAFTDDEAARGLFVTPRNIDELVRSVSKLIAYGINLALHKGLTVEDIDMLTG